MLVLYVPLVWITSKPFGLDGIFWSAFTANLIAGSMAWFWLQRLIVRRYEKEAANQEPALIADSH